MSGADLDAHDLAEAPAAQLVLDRLQQVVGLVGDREVGVAGDAEEVVVGDLHAREERVEVVGDHVLEQHEARAVADRHEARQDLGRDLHARERRVAALGVAHDHAEAQREVRDVGEGLAGADRERRQRREDHAAEVLGERRALVGVDVDRRADDDAVLGERRQQQLGDAARQPRAALEHAPRAAPRASATGVRPSRPGALDAGLDLVVQAGDADHEELVEVRGSRSRRT